MKALRSLSAEAQAANATWVEQQVVALNFQDLRQQLGRKALVEAIDKAFEDDPPTSEEKNLLLGIRAAQRRLLARDAELRLLE